jgi:hypothetical protein
VYITPARTVVELEVVTVFGGSVSVTPGKTILLVR